MLEVYLTGAPENSMAAAILDDESTTYSLYGDISQSWFVSTEVGQQEMQPGELIILKSRSSQRTLANISLAPQGFEIPLSTGLLTKWLVTPSEMIGQKIRCSEWGRVLGEFSAELNRAHEGRESYHKKTCLNQIGALLRLIESSRPNTISIYPERSLAEEIIRTIDGKCTEVSLTAKRLSEHLGISPRTLHRHLALAGGTFGELLLKARVRAAHRMLDAWHFRELTTAEIGLRSGFGDPCHFVRAMKCTLGKSPDTYRRDRFGTANEPSNSSLIGLPANAPCH